MDLVLKSLILFPSICPPGFLPVEGRFGLYLALPVKFDQLQEILKSIRSQGLSPVRAQEEWIIVEIKDWQWDSSDFGLNCDPGYF